MSEGGLGRHEGKDDWPHERDYKINIVGSFGKLCNWLILTQRYRRGESEEGGR